MYAEAGSSPLPRPPPALVGASPSTLSNAAFSCAAACSYAKVDGIPCVRSGSSERGICFSGASGDLSASGSAAFGCSGAALAGSEGAGRDAGAEAVCCWGLDGFWGEFDGALNLELGLLSLAMPLLHIVEAAANAGRVLRVGAAETHLDTAAGWARRMAARESMLVDLWRTLRPNSKKNGSQVLNRCQITAQTGALLERGERERRWVEWNRIQVEPSRQVISSP